MRQHDSRPLVSSWIALAAVLSTAASAQDLFLQGARLVDPATRTAAAGNLLIADGVIAGRPALIGRSPG